jgi:hypothetical protein
LHKEQGYGLIVFAACLIVGLVYLAAFFAPAFGLPAYWREWAVGTPVLLFVLLVLVVVAWIGWTMLTTPPPAPIEPLDSQPKPEGQEHVPPSGGP